jgi:hypothetical protein
MSLRESRTGLPRLRSVELCVTEDRNSSDELIGHIRRVAKFYGQCPAGTSTYYRRLGETRWTLRSHG